MTEVENFSIIRLCSYDAVFDCVANAKRCKPAVTKLSQRIDVTKLSHVLGYHTRLLIRQAFDLSADREKLFVAPRYEGDVLNSQPYCDLRYHWEANDDVKAHSPHNEVVRRLVSNRMPDGEISNTRKRMKSLALAGFEATPVGWNSSEHIQRTCRRRSSCGTRGYSWWIVRTASSRVPGMLEEMSTTTPRCTIV